MVLSPNSLFLSKHTCKLNKFTTIENFIININEDYILLCSDNYNPLFKPFQICNGHVQKIKNIQPQVKTCPEVNSVEVKRCEIPVQTFSTKNKDWMAVPLTLLKKPFQLLLLLLLLLFFFYCYYYYYLFISTKLQLYYYVIF